jgi:uncharacterized protein YjbI with pentapeptide repeats
VESTVKECDFVNSDLSACDFQNSTLSGSLFHNTNLSRANFVGANDYRIDPLSNKLEKAQFSMPEAISLFEAMGIIIE